MQNGLVFLRVTGKIAVVYASSLLAMLIGGQYPEHIFLSLIRDSLLPATPFALILWHNQWLKESRQAHPPKD